MTKILSLCLIVIFSLYVKHAYSQIQNPEDKVRSNIRLKQNDCDLSIIVDVDIEEGWHINSHVLPEGSFSIPTNIRLEKSKNYRASKFIEPKPILEYDEYAEEMLSYHHHKFTLTRKVTSKSFKDYTLKGVFSFQTCDSIKCLPEHEIPFEFKVTKCGPEMELRSNESDTSSAELSSDTTDISENSTEVNKNNNQKKNDTKPANSNKKEESKSMWLIFIISFISGIAALITPCVLPMIPMTVSFFIKQSKSRAAGVGNAFIYGISIIIIFVLLGTIVTSVFGYDALNALSTDVTFNLIFFVLLVVFAISFMGAFEIRLPSSWVNKADQASDKGGIIGIFFMALALALVSFSCTGPIVGTLLVESATVGGMAPFVGMFGFSLALSIPFTLFALFPAWMKSLPKSGGWLNTFKVFLGFLELALAFQYLFKADSVVEGHFLERELFLAIHVAIFIALTMYLFGFIRLPNDGPKENISVGRSLLGIGSLVIAIYLLPGMWGAPLNIVAGWIPDPTYAESPFGIGGGGDTGSANIEGEDTHPGPHKLPLFDDFDKALAYSKKVGKPLFIDFTGKACVNCRKMENAVWGKPGVIEKLRNDVVIVSLYVDHKKELPKKEHKTVEYAPGKFKKITQVGQKWSYFQQSRYKTNTQPYYRMLGPNGEDLSNGSADYEHHGTAKKFQQWLEAGLEAYEKLK